MHDSRQKTILIADDDPSSMLLAEAALIDAGYRVTIAAGGGEAIRQFGEERPDCLVLDVMMPDLSGYEVCRVVRSRPEGRHLPILMLTSLSDHASISESYSSGASDFAQKGLHPRLLVERVRFLLRDRGLQDELITSQSRLELAQRIARVGYWELGLDGRSLGASPLVAEILGREPDERTGYGALLALLPAEDRTDTEQAFRVCACGGGGFTRDHRISPPGREPVHLHQEAQLIHANRAGSEGVILVTLQDVTRLHRAEDTARTLMYTDPATRLFNRRYFAESIARALEHPGGDGVTAVVAVRVHNLDRAVAAHGEGFGNALLTAVATRIQQAISEQTAASNGRQTLSAPAVARIAGDELGIVLCDGRTAERIAEVMAIMLNSVSRPLICLGIEYVPAASAGIAVAAHDGSDADDLISYAHIAANQVGDVGGYSFFSQQLQSQSRRRLSLETDLRLAVEHDQLEIAYQPRVTIATRNLVAVEALLRWPHPQLGSVSPAEFIPIAEQIGLIRDIGRWVLDRACRQMACWRARGLANFRVAVNLAPGQLDEPNLLAMVHSALARHSLPAEALELELTESCVVAAREETRAQLDALRATGVTIALDDFGTGYTSLPQIRRLPVDCLKLDRSLIADLRLDRGAQGIVAAVFAMARILGVRSCAEGLQDGETLQMLRDLGCDEAQGYYVSRALNPSAIEAWLANGGATKLMPSGPRGADDPAATPREDVAAG